MVVQRLLIILALVICFITLLPLIRKDFWVFRVFEFPRVQKWWINLVILMAIGGSVYMGGHDYFPYIIAMLVLNQVYLSYQIFPFTPISKKQLFRNKDSKLPNIRVFISNVFQDNRVCEKLLREIKKRDPDIILLVETDDWWMNKCLKDFGDDYPHRVLQAQDNTYGMLMFSRFELLETRVRHLVKEDIPSITTLIRHPQGNYLRFYALHPEPPIPNENPRSTERDAEILMVGKEAAEEKLPVIVAGDLNDVAWSYSTELFLKISGLLDPRRGRGLYSTFHAKYPLMRWPLDHIFCSSHFRLNKLTVLPYINSDHFPVFIDLALEGHAESGQESLDADEGDEALADEKIEAAK